MSLAYFIVVNHPEPGFDTFVNGKYVAKQSEQLDTLAKRLGVTPLESFLSVSQNVAEEFDLADTPTEEWFDAEQGLQTVQALIQHLELHPDEVKNVKGVLEDLREYEEVLKNTQKAKMKWRFEMDF